MKSFEMDHDLHMVKEKSKPINMKRLWFECWLVNRGLGEHQPFSLPRGELALTMVVLENKPIEQIWREKIVGKD